MLASCEEDVAEVAKATQHIAQARGLGHDELASLPLGKHGAIKVWTDPSEGSTEGEDCSSEACSESFEEESSVAATPAPSSSSCSSPPLSPCGTPCGTAVSSETVADEPQEEEEREEEVDPQEEELRQAVPQLLESMNLASEEVNRLERQVEGAQARYRRKVVAYTALYEELRSKDKHTFDRVKPYFSAVQEVKAASHRMHSLASEFGVAASRLEQATSRGQDASTQEVHRLRLQRDDFEGAYAQALREHRKAQELLEALRARLGATAVARQRPAFERLQEQQLELVVEQSRMNNLVERARHAKSRYHKSMRGLEDISVAVHNMRQAHARRI